MRYRMKYFLTIMLFALIGGQLGCKKFLDRKPLGGAIEGDRAQGAVEEQVFGMYSATRNFGFSGLPFLLIHTARSDDSEKGSAPTDQADAESIYDNFSYTKDHWMMSGYYDDHYALITLANNVVHTVDSLGLTDELSLTNRGEATFMRAWAYFDLVRSFGEVPLINFRVFNQAQANINKSTVQQIYAQIDADLQFAEQHLPMQWEDQYAGRLTKGAATTLYAKTLLYRENWASALAKCEEVINSNVYSLITPYSDVFTEESENGKESILEIQNFTNSNGSQNISNEFAQYQGVRGSGEWDLGWGFNTPEQNLVDFFEAGDPRKDATILFSGQSDGRGATVPPSPPLARRYWNKKVYTTAARRAATGNRFGSWMNMRILRYADVLLMAAEAANEIGGTDNTTKALDYLERVRGRARGGAGVLPAITTTNQGELRTAIRRERRAEFAMEYERFFDLVRWGTAQAELNAAGHPYAPRNRYLPLPQAAIDKSGGVLQQNPEYP